MVKMKKFVLLFALFMVPVAANAGIIRTAFKGTKAVVKTAEKAVVKAAKVAYKVAY